MKFLLLTLLLVFSGHAEGRNHLRNFLGQSTSAFTDADCKTSVENLIKCADDKAPNATFIKPAGGEGTIVGKDKCLKAFTDSTLPALLKAAIAAEFPQNPQYEVGKDTTANVLKLDLWARLFHENGFTMVGISVINEGEAKKIIVAANKVAQNNPTLEEAYKCVKHALFNKVADWCIDAISDAGKRETFLNSFHTQFRKQFADEAGLAAPGKVQDAEKDAWAKLTEFQTWFKDTNGLDAIDPTILPVLPANIHAEMRILDHLKPWEGGKNYKNGFAGDPEKNIPIGVGKAACLKCCRAYTLPVSEYKFDYSAECEQGSANWTFPDFVKADLSANLQKLTQSECIVAYWEYMKNKEEEPKKKALELISAAFKGAAGPQASP